MLSADVARVEDTRLCNLFKVGIISTVGYVQSSSKVIVHTQVFRCDFWRASAVAEKAARLELKQTRVGYSNRTKHTAKKLTQ